MRVERPSVTDYTTVGNSYADVPFTKEGSTDTRVYWDAWHLAGVKILHFFATTKDLKVQILGSLDGTNFDTILFAEFTLIAGSSSPVEKRIVAYWPYIKVQVKPSTSSQHGTLSVRAIGTTVSGEVDTELTATIDPTGLALASHQASQLAAEQATKVATEALAALISGGKYPISFPPTKTATALATAQSIPAANPVVETTLTNAAALDVQAYTDIVVAGVVTFGSAAADNAEVAIYGKMASGDSFTTLYLDKKTVTASAGNAVPFQFDPLDIRGWSHLKITCKNLDTTPGATHDAIMTAKAMLIA